MSSNGLSERASVFVCKGDRAVAISSVPARCFKRGVLIAVGGPQYRAGSHRQFTLLCRALAAQGIAAMRFDYRGMGDSEGAPRSFEDVQDDLRAAIDLFLAENPEVEEIVLWGLCDAASAALLYARHDRRVTGLVLLNPWVRTAEGLARAYIRGYYVRRLFEASLWKKVLGRQFGWAEAGRSLVRNVRNATQTQAVATDAQTQAGSSGTLRPQRMLEGWRGFRGRILLVLSGNDLTADEFRTLVANDRGWRKALAEARVEQCEVPEANHTFSRASWRAQIEQRTGRWVRSW